MHSVRRHDDAPPTTAPTYAPDEAAKIRVELGEILGVDGNDEQALRAAFESVLLPLEEALKRMNPREIASCRARGVAPERYAAIRDSIRSKFRR